MDEPCGGCSDGMEPFIAQLEEKIGRFGHAVVATEWESHNGMSIPLSYTIGLSDFSCPELIVFGLPVLTAQHLLNDAAARFKDGPLPVDEQIKELATVPVVFKRIPDARTRQICGILRARGFVAGSLQMVWPDPYGSFPWDVDCNLKYLHMQPVLFLTS